MRRLADELDTGAASLYWHVGSKDGLLELIFDASSARVEMPDPDPTRWQEQLKEVARHMRGDDPAPPRHRPHLDRPHPDGAERAAVLRARLRDPAGGRRPGSSSRSPGHHLLFAIMNGFTLDETTDLGVEDEAPLDEQAANMARDYVAALPAERFPNLVAVAGHFGLADNDQSFELLIDLFVDGLAQRIHARDQ